MIVGKASSGPWGLERIDDVPPREGVHETALAGRDIAEVENGDNNALCCEEVVCIDMGEEELLVAPERRLLEKEVLEDIMIHRSSSAPPLLEGVHRSETATTLPHSPLRPAVAPLVVEDGGLPRRPPPPVEQLPSGATNGASAGASAPHASPAGSAYVVANRGSRDFSGEEHIQYLPGEFLHSLLLPRDEDPAAKEAEQKLVQQRRFSSDTVREQRGLVQQRRWSSDTIVSELSSASCSSVGGARTL